MATANDFIGGHQNRHFPRTGNRIINTRRPWFQSQHLKRLHRSGRFFGMDDWEWTV